MDRTIPNLVSDDISLYTRTYYSVLRSSREVPIATFEETHKNIGSALHNQAKTDIFDIDAFTYCSLRLPSCIFDATVVVMGQTERVYAKNGIEDVENWTPVSALARRRAAFFDGSGTLAYYIASRSDIDDLVTILTAFQIETRKLRTWLTTPSGQAFMAGDDGSTALDADAIALSEGLRISATDAEKFIALSKAEPRRFLAQIAAASDNMKIRLLAGSHTDYSRAIRRWWSEIATSEGVPDLTGRPVHFLSSNTHSVANVLSGYIAQIRGDLERFLEAPDLVDVKQKYWDLKDKAASTENVLYYALKKFEAAYPERVQDRLDAEKAAGITRVTVPGTFDIEAQIIDLSVLKPDRVDPRLILAQGSQLSCEDVLINIEYPLGMAARLILSEIARNVDDLRSVISIGKAATLNARVGDVMIPNVVHDEHSQNTYLFQNCFGARDVVSFLEDETVMDNQKSITVLGTFLQNHDYMSVLYKEGFADVEMEAGPFLGAIYEMVRPKRNPTNEIVDLHDASLHVGFLHYASDTPLNTGHNLGSSNLSKDGITPTYAVTLAALNQVLSIASKK